MAAKKGKKKAGTKRRTVVVVGKKHRKRRSVSGSVGRTKNRSRPRKKRGFMGATGGRTSLGEIGMMAIGVATGAGLTHIILRPVEKRLTDKWPMVGKFIAAGEIFLGGLIALKAKGNFGKSLGVGILAGGVHGVMKQLNVYKEIPKIMGSNNEYQELKIPINGPLQNMLGSLLDGKREVMTRVVAGTDHTKVVAGPSYTSAVAETEFDEFANMPVKGW